jgi:hypothetical protein
LWWLKHNFFRESSRFYHLFHIPQEWNKVVDGVEDDWKVDDWGGLLDNLSQDLEEMFLEDMRCFLGVI